MKIDDKDFLPYYRWEHRATVGYGAREFIVFIDNLPLFTGEIPKTYIEEVSGGHLEQVEDDSLWEALGKFAGDMGLLEMQPPIIKPSNERFI